MASDMILHIDSDAAYSVQGGARIRIAGHYILSSHPPPNPQIPNKIPNALILVECKTLWHVVASAVEAETGGLFHNAQTILHIRMLLDALGHSQPPTPLKTDNSTANVFVNKSLCRRKSKSWDMKFLWLRDKELMRKIWVFWDKGKNNDADYFTKHHLSSHHQAIRNWYILKDFCIKKNYRNKVFIDIPYARVYWRYPTNSYSILHTHGILLQTWWQTDKYPPMNHQSGYH